jgi:hypothetical protein
MSWWSKEFLKMRSSWPIIRLLCVSMMGLLWANSGLQCDRIAYGVFEKVADLSGNLNRSIQALR